MYLHRFQHAYAYIYDSRSTLVICFTHIHCLIAATSASPSSKALQRVSAATCISRHSAHEMTHQIFVGFSWPCLQYSLGKPLREC